MNVCCCENPFTIRCDVDRGDGADYNSLIGNFGLQRNPGGVVEEERNLRIICM